MRQTLFVSINIAKSISMLNFLIQTQIIIILFTTNHFLFLLYILLRDNETTNNEMCVCFSSKIFNHSKKDRFVIVYKVVI